MEYKSPKRVSAPVHQYEFNETGYRLSVPFDLTTAQHTDQTKKCKFSEKEELETTIVEIPEYQHLFKESSYWYPHTGEILNILTKRRQ